MTGVTIASSPIAGRRRLREGRRASQAFPIAIDIPGQAREESPAVAARDDRERGAGDSREA